MLGMGVYKNSHKGDRIMSFNIEDRIYICDAGTDASAVNGLWGYVTNVDAEAGLSSEDAGFNVAVIKEGGTLRVWRVSTTGTYTLLPDIGRNVRIITDNASMLGTVVEDSHPIMLSLDSGDLYAVAVDSKWEYVPNDIPDKPYKNVVSPTQEQVHYSFIVTKTIYHDPYTIVFYRDSQGNEHKAIAKCDPNDTYNPDFGFDLASLRAMQDSLDYYISDYIKRGGKSNGQTD